MWIHAALAFGWVLAVLQWRLMWRQSQAIVAADEALTMAREELKKSDELMAVVTRRRQMAGGSR